LHETTLSFDASMLTAGLLHAALIGDVQGTNPLGAPPLKDAEKLSDGLATVRDLQFRFCVAHEIGHAALATRDTRDETLGRMSLMLERLRSHNHSTDSPWINDLSERVSRAGSDHDWILDEALCDSYAADALGRAAASGRLPLGLVGDDLSFALDSYFLLMWFLEALRFRITALWIPAGCGQPIGPDIAMFRGRFAMMQFLLSYLAKSETESSKLYDDVLTASSRSEELLEWLNASLEIAQASDNLEAIIRIGARSLNVYRLTPDLLRSAALLALGWKA
jgi:hypothetical protein